MQYIIIKNWETFQQYKDRRPKWIKLLTEIIEEFDADGNPKKFYLLSDTAKKTFPYLLCLRSKFNEKIPYPSDKYLKKELGLKSISLQPLIDAGFIEIIEDSVSKPYSSVQTNTENIHQSKSKSKSKSKRESKRCFLEFVFLSDDEHKKLTARYGDNNIRSLVAELNDYIGSSGKIYKSHYYTLLSWARRKKLPVLPTSEEITAKEKHRCDKEKQRIRDEDGQYYRDRTTKELELLLESRQSQHIVRRWLIKEILQERKNVDIK